MQALLLAAGAVLLAAGVADAVPPFANSCTANFAGGARLAYPFCDQTLPIDARVADLVSRLTDQVCTNDQKGGRSVSGRQRSRSMTTNNKTSFPSSCFFVY